MPTLPSQGGSSGTWGTELNTWLTTEHNSNGTHNIPFAVLDIPGLSGWWDASDAATITQSGGAVSQWNDKSGNAYHVVQATGSAKPTTGTRTINSLNVLDFDGGDVLRKTSGFRGEQAYGIYAIVEPDTVSGTDLILHAGTTGVADWSFFLNAGVITYFGGTGSATGPTLSTGTPYLVRTRLGTAGNGYHMTRANGTDGTPVVAGGPVFSSIDIGNTDTGSNFFDGKIGEIILVSDAVGPQLDLKIRTYLAAKWNVTA